MIKLSFRSIKFQFFVMVFLMALFAAAIIVYSGISVRNEKITEAMRDSAMLADSIFNEHEKMVADVHQLLVTLAQLPDVKSLDAGGTQPILREILGSNPGYSNILIADPTGRVLASALPAKDTNVSDRLYFINALATGRFSAGEFITSRFSGKPVLVFGYPIKSREGETLGIIAMGIDMRYYKTLLDTMPLPSGSSYLLLDHKGTIMTRGINPMDFVGEQYDAGAFRMMANGPEKDTFVAVAHDGIRRFISYRKVRLEGEQTPYMYIRSGIPVSAALSLADRTLRRNLSLFTLALFFVVISISLIAKHSILDRVASLEKASGRLADGDMNFRVSDLVSGGELGRLALTFDHMARQIASREEALSESRQRYLALFEQSPYGVLMLDAEGKILDFNETAHRYLGYTREEFRSLTISDIDPLESPDGLEARIKRLLEEGGGEFEVRHRTKQGEMRDVHVITKVLTLSGQTFLQSIWRDITERKRAEEALKTSEERLNTILDNVGASIFIKDEKYRYTYVNRRVCDVLGKRPEEIIGKGDEDFFSAESVVEIMRSDRPVIERGETVTREETELTSSEGVARTYWTVKLPLRDGTGRVTGLCGISTDITERKHAEEVKDRLLMAVSAATEGIAITDDEDRFIYVNDAHARVYGYQREELIGKRWRDTVSRDLQPAIEKEFEKTLHNRAVGIWSGEAPAIRKDGTVVPTEVTATARWGEAGSYLGHICIVRDITERKRSEAQIMSALAEKEVLLKEIHHRVKNNLNVIASLLSLQSQYVRDPAVVGILDECRNRINSMALIHNKLYQSRNLSSVDFREYLNSLVSMLSSSYIHEGDNVRVITDIQELSLDIDTAVTCGLITNELVTNCLKHAFPERRGGTINISLFSEGGKHILSVRDDGTGLPDQFDLKDSKTLGLKMVMMLTRQLEGTMDVGSGKGAEIRISF